MHRLNFETLHQYETSATGIVVPVEIRVGTRGATLFARVDTGSAFCIFERGYGAVLNLEIESGEEERIRTATGDQFLVYGHNVTLQTFNLEFDVMVYFAKDENFKRNVLGRRGWLQRIRFGLNDYDGKLYVSDYDDE